MREGARVSSILMTADAVGGVWRYSIDLGRALRLRGVRTTLAVMGTPPSDTQRREAEVADVAIVDRPFRLEWMEDPWQDVARAGRWLMALEQTVAPDVIQLNGYAHAVLPWTRPVVVVAHSCVRSWWRAVNHEPAPERLDRYTRAVADGLHTAAVVVAPSRAMRDALIAEYEGAALRPIQIIPNGVDGVPTVFGPDLDAKEPFVLSAGRTWDAGKNVAALSSAAPGLWWPVYVAGSTHEPGKGDCELPSVHALGTLPAEEMSSWYRRASIYALPARYEPFGLSILEAARAGCALVLGKVASLRENWSDAAVFVDPEDPGELRDAVQALIDDPPRRGELGRAAFRRSQTFGIDRAADAYLNLYESLIVT